MPKTLVAARGSQKRSEIIWSRAGFLARRLHQIYVAIFLEKCAEAQITPVQWGVMMVVFGASELGYIEIGEQLGLDRSNVASVVSRLKERNLVSEKISKADARKRAVSISAAGRQLIKQFEPRVRESHDRLLAPLTKSEQAVFMKLLRRIVEQNNRFSRAPLNRPSQFDL